MARRLARIGTLALGFGLAGSLASAEDSYRGYEIPAYTVEQQAGAVEIRRYAPHLVAEVTVAGPQSGALGRGFRILAGYIFGGNATGTEVAMTAPVAQTGEGDVWTVAFAMPRAYTAETLPPPDNPAIRFVMTEAERVIVLRFAGIAGQRRLDEAAAQLRDIAARSGIAIEGPPRFYFYDDPFTLPWNRRNEVAFRIAD
jgi:hypothetical protein